MNLVLNKAMDLFKEVEATKNELKSRFQNMNSPFAERWQYFLAFNKLGGSHDSYIYDGWNDLPIFPSTNYKGEVTNELNWYDDFGVDKYQTVNLLDRLDQILDKFWYETNSILPALYEEFTEQDTINAVDWALLVYQHPILIQAAEALMRDATTEFTYDW